MTQHIPKHIHQFSRYLRIRYDGQPNAPSIIDQNNRAQDIPFPENQTTPQEQQQPQQNINSQLSEDEQQEGIPINITIIQQETLTPISTKKTKNLKKKQI